MKSILFQTCRLLLLCLTSSTRGYAFVVNRPTPIQHGLSECRRVAGIPVDRIRGVVSMTGLPHLAGWDAIATTASTVVQSTSSVESLVTNNLGQSQIDIGTVILHHHMLPMWLVAVAEPSSEGWPVEESAGTVFGKWVLLIYVLFSLLAGVKELASRVTIWLSERDPTDTD